MVQKISTIFPLDVTVQPSETGRDRSLCEMSKRNLRTEVRSLRVTDALRASGKAVALLELPAFKNCTRTEKYL